MGIECDGKTYHQAKTARDRDRLRQQNLEQLGWTIHRIWSTEWLHHPERELDRVLERINELVDGTVAADSSSNGASHGPEPGSQGEGSDSNGRPQQAGPWDGTEIDEPDCDGQSPGEPHTICVPYQVAAISYTPGELWETPTPRLADAITTCVDAEGPIHHDLLVRRMADAWGYQRAGSRIARHVDEGIAYGRRRGRIRQVGAFLWPAGNIEVVPEVVPRGAAPDGTLRDIAHVPDEEIVQAISMILNTALSLSPDELAVQTARAFGYHRTGSDIRARILEIVDWMHKSNVLEIKGDRMQPAHA